MAGKDDIPVCHMALVFSSLLDQHFIQDMELSLL